MQTPVEIAPSKASQGHHRRKDAEEQMKNLTLARTGTQVRGLFYLLHILSTLIKKRHILM